MVKSKRINVFIFLLVMCQLLIVNHFPTVCGARNYCPKYCNCDLYKNLNRADCSNQRLISASVEVPNNVEILDLSGNGITILDNVCFEDLVHLKNFTLSHNSIHTIFLDAFKSLKNLQFIDLSYNRLEDIDERILEFNQKLIGLNLAGNKFMSLQNKALLISPSLQYLSLHNSQVTHIYPALFEYLPNLIKLDLSENLLITITPNSFSILSRLKFVNLNGNRWICDRNTELTIKYLVRQNINYRLDKCKFEFDETKPRKGPKMFERMVMLENPETTTTERIKTNVELIWRNSRILEIGERSYCISEDYEKTCLLLDKCMADATNAANRTSIPPSKDIEKPYRIGFDSRRNEFEKLHMHKVFFIGLAIGFVLGLLLPVSIYFMFRLCSRPSKRKYRPLNMSIESRRMRNNNVSEQRTYSTRTSPPPLNRSFSTPVRRTPENGQGSDFATFVARLFERPRREQYRQTINQNTAQLIRRISRSNLLIGSRLSQHFVDTRSNRGGNPSSSGSSEQQDTEQLINSENDITETRADQENSGQFQYTTNMNSPIVTRRMNPRPETPPPSYTEVVSNI